MGYSFNDLKAMHQNSPKAQWVVEGLLRNNRVRPSILAGFAHAGKSTLARQLGVAVAGGKDFLGRKTWEGRVLYWQSEDSTQDAFEDLELQQPSENYRIFQSQEATVPGRNTELVSTLKTACDEGQPYRLVIIETLDDYLNPDNLNSVAELAKLLVTFSADVVRPFQETSFLMLHQFNKSTDASVTSNLLLKIAGAHSIVSKTDAKWFLHQVSDVDPRRIFSTKVRRGTNIEPTFLDYDPKTDVSTLGMKVADVKETVTVSGKVLRMQNVVESIVSNVEQKPGIPKAKLLTRVGGKTTVTSALIDQCIKDGRLRPVKRGQTTHLFTPTQTPTDDVFKQWGKISEIRVPAISAPPTAGANPAPSASVPVEVVATSKHDEITKLEQELAGWVGKRDACKDDMVYFYSSKVREVGNALEVLRAEGLCKN